MTTPDPTEEQPETVTIYHIPLNDTERDSIVDAIQDVGSVYVDATKDGMFDHTEQLMALEHLLEYLGVKGYEFT